MTRKTAIVAGLVLMVPGGCLLVPLLVAAGASVALLALDREAPAAMEVPVAHAVISQPFGCTALGLEAHDPTCPGGYRHTGVDLAAALGTPVMASADGIAQVIHDAGGFGLHVVIEHGGGVMSLYGHLSGASVGDGESVSAGQVIGAVGSSGNSTGPHLHFEVRRDGVPVDPTLYVALP
jgi:murein DD-endopeptidase MepM/ murein hydrolase activator NlpD